MLDLIIVLDAQAFSRRLPWELQGACLFVPRDFGTLPRVVESFPLVWSRNVWKCRCQTFNVLIIPLDYGVRRFSTLNQKILDQKGSLKRVNCWVMQYLSSPAFVSHLCHTGTLQKLCIFFPISSFCLGWVLGLYL